MAAPIAGRGGRVHVNATLGADRVAINGCPGRFDVLGVQRRISAQGYLAAGVLTPLLVMASFQTGPTIVRVILRNTGSQIEQFRLWSQPQFPGTPRLLTRLCLAPGESATVRQAMTPNDVLLGEGTYDGVSYCIETPQVDAQTFYFDDCGLEIVRGGQNEIVAFGEVYSADAVFMRGYGPANPEVLTGEISFPFTGGTFRPAPGSFLQNLRVMLGRGVAPRYVEAASALVRQSRLDLNTNRLHVAIESAGAVREIVQPATASVPSPASACVSAAAAWRAAADDDRDRRRIMTDPFPASPEPSPAPRRRIVIDGESS